MVKKTSSKTIALENRVEELENNYKRVLADYQNQQRRHQQLQSDMITMANASLIEKLLTILDSLELAQNHLKDAGLAMVINQTQSLLKNEGLEEIKTDRQEFDPLTMECTEVVLGDKNQVVETVQKGYSLSNKVLRPAKVKVGSGE